jgi:hypothetical protein
MFLNFVPVVVECDSILKLDIMNKLVLTVLC